MNNVIQFEDRVSRSRSKHEGESSAEVCDRLSRTRVYSQRQLPTDHDYAVPTREYQLDQSSPLPATAAADSVLEVRKRKPPHRFAAIDRVTPYQLPGCPQTANYLQRSLKSGHLCHSRTYGLCHSNSYAALGGLGTDFGHLGPLAYSSYAPPQVGRRRSK